MAERKASLEPTVPTTRRLPGRFDWGNFWMQNLPPLFFLWGQIQVPVSASPRFENDGSIGWNKGLFLVQVWEALATNSGQDLRQVVQAFGSWGWKTGNKITFDMWHLRDVCGTLTEKTPSVKSGYLWGWSSSARRDCGGLVAQGMNLQYTAERYNVISRIHRNGAEMG